MSSSINRNTKARNYVFTLFNFDLNDLSRKIESADWVKYCVYQLEQCPESSRQHLQGYIELNSPTRVGRIKTLLGDSVHLEKRRGTRDQARDYCRKLDTRIDGPWEFGDFGVGQGQRNDLLAVKELLDSGAPEVDIADSAFETWCKYHKAFARYRLLKCQPRDFKTRVVVRWGVPGSGKTRGVFDACEPGSVFVVSRPNGSAVWFDGYEPAKHTNVLLDDFYGWLPWSLLLQMCDRYPLTVPVKGGMVNFRPTTVWITSNSAPNTWYDYSRSGIELGALDRRIEETLHFTELP